jgi:uncharacterized glyoxalase superfamily protein PhnB
MAITAHIVVQGAERAVAFYRDAFDAVEVPDDEVAAAAAQAFG